MAATDWRWPQTAAEAADLLAQPGHQAVAGGTTVLDLARLGHVSGPAMVDLSRLPREEIRVQEGALLLDAGLSNTAVARAPLVQQRFPALSEAILSGASGQIRNAATLGGNLLQALRCAYFRDPSWPCNRRDAGSGCPAIEAPLPGDAILGITAHCRAAHPSDMAVALLALDARLHGLVGARRFEMPLADLYPLPSPDAGLTALPRGALVTAISLPLTTARSGYEKLRGRASYEFAAASVAAVLESDRGRITRAAIAFGGIATTPWRTPAAEALLLGQGYDARATDDFLDLAFATAAPVEATAHKLPLARGALHHLLQRLTK
ncbi:FAD binding domain-containing protein [Falsigemmobacter faecalis]|uniref:Xanthine dehydrogenase family protein subunit M n=1 Tax=Falsigemmobacter faecalis TaxID=2488730 RepID=A0A3P3DPW4_9RHOB|nr:FAD binding domain-containing protein [Falsigemmobacter faecalis]RRH76225.1 xanthine dehydrogenase family protein subunit M [Falsigemmobacter faecalis]